MQHKDSVAHGAPGSDGTGYSTESLEDHERTKPGEPCRVIGLRMLPDGPQFPFETHQRQGHRILIVGAGQECDIRLDEASVSYTHCIIVRKHLRTEIHDMDSTNGVWIDGVRVRSAELRSGSLITLGRVTLTPMLEHPSPSVVIPARTLAEFIQRAEFLYGGVRPAAKALGIPSSTLRDWLKKLGTDHA